MTEKISITKEMIYQLNNCCGGTDIYVDSLEFDELKKYLNSSQGFDHMTETETDGVFELVYRNRKINIYVKD